MGYSKAYMFNGSKVVVWIGLLSLLLTPSYSFSAKATANLYSDTQFTNNARLSSFNTKDDFIQRMGLNFKILEERKRFNADANFDLSQDYYLNQTYSNQTQVTTGFGLFNFDIVEEFLDWRTSYSRVQLFSSSLAIDTPDNREERNTFRTGPSINYRINSATSVRFYSNYVQVENSDKDTSDTKRGDFGANYTYILNSLTRLNFGGSYDKVFESSSELTGRDRNDEVANTGINIGLSRSLPKGVMNFSFGKNRVEGNGREATSSNFFSFNLEREELLSHDLTVSASRTISDTSIGFEDEASSDLSFSNSSESSVISGQNGLDIVTKTQLGVGLLKRFDLYQYQFGATWGDTEYQTQSSDERVVGASFHIKQRFEDGIVWGVKLQSDYVKPIGQGNQGGALTQTYTLDGQYQWLRYLGFKGFLSYERRGYTRNTIAEYEEFSVGVRVIWNVLQ